VAFALNLVSLLIVLGLSYIGMMWLAGVVHRAKETREERDAQ